MTLQTAKELQEQEPEPEPDYAPPPNPPVATVVDMQATNAPDDAIWVDGHPKKTFNGLYTKQKMHKGRPVYKREGKKERYCYHYERDSRWFLADTYDPARDPRRDPPAAWARAPKEGTLPPTGDCPWQCFQGGLSSWKQCSLVLTAGVRSLYRTRNVPARNTSDKD